MFQVIITSRAEKEFAKLPQNLKEKFYEEFKKLSISPLLHPNVKKLQGTEFGYRLRIGRWRICLPYFRKKKELKLLIFF